MGNGYILAGCLPVSCIHARINRHVMSSLSRTLFLLCPQSILGLYCVCDKVTLFLRVCLSMPYPDLTGGGREYKILYVTLPSTWSGIYSPLPTHRTPVSGVVYFLNSLNLS